MITTPARIVPSCRGAVHRPAALLRHGSSTELVVCAKCRIANDGASPLPTGTTSVRGRRLESAPAHREHRARLRRAARRQVIASPVRAPATMMFSSCRSRAASRSSSSGIPAPMKRSTDADGRRRDLDQRGANAWGSPPHVQPIDGSAAHPLAMGIARAGMISQDGRRSRSTATRRPPGANIAATRGEHRRDERRTATSARSRTPINNSTFANNVFSMGADGMITSRRERRHVQPLAHGVERARAPQQVTTFKGGKCVLSVDLPADGKKIVFQND